MLYTNWLVFICFRYWFNPKLLEVADTSHMQIDVGDFVLVIDSARKVKALQDEDHGGWSGKMRKVNTCRLDMCRFRLALLEISTQNIQKYCHLTSRHLHLPPFFYYITLVIVSHYNISFYYLYSLRMSV